MHHAAFRVLLMSTIGLFGLVPAAAQRDTIRAGIDLVVVPASVRDGDGKLVYDLQQDDFSILEDGRPQRIQQFSIDPSPLSVAVLIDTGIGGSALRRFASSIVSLSSALIEADEAEVYRFDHVVTKLSDFTNDQEMLEKNLRVIQKLAEGKGDQSNSPLLVLPGRGPRWLRWLLDRGAESRVLNDAMFTAATDLEKQPQERRRVILVISDGQVAGNTIHTLEETQDRLVRGQIQTYGVTVGMALLEGSSSIIHTYTSITGGDVYRARTQNAMETAFSRIMEQARHQYVLSYVSNNEVAGELPVPRKIDVEVRRSGLKVNHRKTYLQYPPAR
jgi:VWFA-related protein